LQAKRRVAEAGGGRGVGISYLFLCGDHLTHLVDEDMDGGHGQVELQHFQHEMLHSENLP